MLLAVVVLWLLGCQGRTVSSDSSDFPAAKNGTARKDTAYFAAGCFWCVEAIFESVRGVTNVISGYAGGTQANPTYEQVSSGTTGHAEAVMVVYDTAQIDFPRLVNLFFSCHDPTQVNRQGPDLGTPYRSVAFYRNQKEKQIISDTINALMKSGKYGRPIATEVSFLELFWPAEAYHQDFVARNPMHPYVRNESLPRLQRFRQQNPSWLKH